MRPDDPSQSGDVHFIGTATVLIRFGGFTLLTDPNFLHRGERAYVGMGLTTRRLTEPAIDVAALPPVDAVVLSHHHGDHFDRRAAAGLPKDVPIVTEPHAARKLRRQGFTAPIALENWDNWSTAKDGVRLSITSVPARHAPTPLDRIVPPVMGSVLSFESAHEVLLRIYITGDTLFFEGLKEIGRQFPDLDLCLLHLGGTKIAGVLLTMDASQGVSALRAVDPDEALPIHYDDYTLFKSSLDDFKAAAENAGLDTRLVYLERGQHHRLVSRQQQGARPFGLRTSG